MQLFKSASMALAAAGLFVSAASAAPIPGAGSLNGVAAGQQPIETVQYVWGGRNYCWYPGGWRGPGWYWCGYAWRRGFGWGGPVGWRGWGGGPGWRGGPGWHGRGGWGGGGHGGWHH
jgi:hypothetical protein